MRAAREAACLSAARVYPGLPEQQNRENAPKPIRMLYGRGECAYPGTRGVVETGSLGGRWLTVRGIKMVELGEGGMQQEPGSGGRLSSVWRWFRRFGSLGTSSSSISLP